MKIKIFISYSSANDNKMKALKRAIIKDNLFEPIVVADKRSPKKSLSDKVKEGISESDYIVPILTRSSIYNQWVNQEIGYSEALGTKIKIFPIVENAIFNELKGFIHKNLELPYKYEPSDNKSKEAKHFRKSYQLLLKDIANDEQIKEDPILSKIKHKFQRVNAFEYRAITLPVEKEITDKTTYHLRAKLSTNQQHFIAYYLFETDKGESKWLGYKNDRSPDFIRNDEFTKTIKNNNQTSYAIDENVLSAITERFKGLEGKPLRIKLVRFRGDKISNEIIRFYYAFSDMI